VNPNNAPGPLGAMPIDQFLDLLASSNPTPGGGGIAALAGSLAAGLISMVCNLTIGKPKYADVEPEVKALLTQSEVLRARLHQLVDEDATAYSGVMDAFKLPRNSDEEKAARSARIQEATIEASRVPLEIARECAKVIDLAAPAARLTNVQAIGDVAMAAYLAEGALRGAVVNIDINLRSVKDREAVKGLLDAGFALSKGQRERVENIVQEGMARL
jgi:formiminotetrahydrofolate cyclodeaminase